MERVKVKGLTHFVGSGRFTICGMTFGDCDLFGKMMGTGEKSTDPVDCPECAKLYCRIKNTPWNEVEDKALDQGIYAAVKTDGGSDVN